MAALSDILVCDASCILARHLMMLPELASGSASTEEQPQYNHACSSEEDGLLGLKHCHVLFSLCDFDVFHWKAIKQPYGNTALAKYVSILLSFAIEKLIQTLCFQSIWLLRNIIVLLLISTVIVTDGSALHRWFGLFLFLSNSCS